jgi:hypothetical protein
VQSPSGSAWFGGLVLFRHARRDPAALADRDAVSFGPGRDVAAALPARRCPLSPARRQLISGFRPKTGDRELDAKFMDAVVRFQSRPLTNRQDALEKL